MEDYNFQDSKPFSSDNSVYQAQLFLGSGAFGEVLQCQNLTSNETVAVKFIKDSRYIEAAKKEVQHKLCLSMFHFYIALKTNSIHTKHISYISYIPQVALLKEMKELNSNRFNIVRLIDSFSCDGLYCLEFEKLDTDLHDFVHNSPSKCLELKEIRPIMQQVSFFNTKCATKTAL